MDDLKIVKGNEFATLIKVRAFKYDNTEILDFDLHNVSDISIVAHINAQNKAINSSNYQILDDNMLKIEWTSHEELGPYLLEVCGEYENKKWRFFDKRPIFTIVNTNAEANIPPQSIVEDNVYKISFSGIKLWSASYNNKIDYIGEDNYVYKYDADTNNYVKSDIYVKGDCGTDGLSAYQIAVEHGYEGTEEQWLNSIKDDTAADVIEYINTVGYLTRDSLKDILAELMDEIDSEIDSNQ